MAAGSWFLIYDDYDSMENHHPECTEKVPLKATDKTGALREGEEKWRERLSKGTFLPSQWCTEPYPKNPRVAYEIPITISSS